MTEAFAGAALAVSLLGVYLADSALGGGRPAVVRFLRQAALPLCAAGLAVVAAILWGPLRHARPGGIDGEASYRIALKTFLDTFLFYRITLLQSRYTLQAALHKWAWVVLLVFLGCLLVTAVLIIRRWLRVKRLRNLSVQEPYLLLFSLTALLTFLFLRVEPVLLDHPYFAERRLLFTLPLLFTACPLWLRWLGGWGACGRAAMRAGAALVLLLTAHLASQFTLRWYFGWEFDAGTKAIANLLRQKRPSPPVQVRVGVSWPVVESLNFYRRLYGMDWMAPLTRETPACYYDYYVVYEEELPTLKRFELEWLYKDPVAHAILAQPGRNVRVRLAALREAGFTGRLACQADLTLKESWAELGRTGVNGHFLRDFMDAPETDSQRWTFEKPALLFYVPERRDWKFKLDFRLHSVTFKQTGPLLLSVWINGKRLGEKRCASASDYTFEQPVPREWIREDGVMLVETTLDRYYVAPDDGQKLGYLFLRAGLLGSLVH